MYSDSPQRSPRKAPGGSVQVKVSHDRLQLVFTYAGQRRYMSLGIWDSPANRKIAEAKAKLIESDILYERFDPTLAKYGTKSSLNTTITPTVTPIAPAPKVAELWMQYRQFRSTQVSASTLLRDYDRKVTKRIQNSLYTIHEAVEIRDWLLKQYSSEEVRRMINKLHACCD